MRFNDMNKTVLVLVIIVVAIIGIVTYFYPCNTDESNRLQAAGVFFASIVSFIALVYAIMEYAQHKKAARTTLICQYMNRYSTDKNAQAVQQYILDAGLTDKKTGRIIGFNSDAKVKHVPTVRQMELFMHLIEELQLCIDEKMISKDTAIKLFGYYVCVFHRIPEFHKDITDYEEEEYWHYYLKFANSIPEDFHLR